MAKLPPVGGHQNGNSAVDNITKVGELKTNDTVRAPRQPGVGSGFRGDRAERGERGRGRGGRSQEARKVDVPTTDFDFESSNAKFNKEDLVKEAIAGSPLGEHPQSGDDANGESIPVAPSYNKKSSFFDDLSSDNKDRAENSASRPGGREWRGEEQKKNVETFGQGSVDNGFRGGFRGRGRGRGGFRGRGFTFGGNGAPGRGGPGGRGGFRGGRGDFQTFGVAQ
jgi:protein LSM14